MRSLLLLCGLLAVVTAAPVITPGNNGQFLTLRPDGERVQHTPCDYCQDVVTTLEDFVSDPQTQQAVAEYVEAAVCAALPSDFGEMCKQEVPVLVAAAAQEIAAALTPSDVCGVMGVCPGAASAAQRLGLSTKLGGTPFDCPVCKMVVVAFVARMQDPQRRAELEEDMRAACGNLQPEAKARCLQDVAALFSALDNLLHDVDPEGVCQVVDFCSGKPKDQAKAASAALDEGKEKQRGAAALRTLREAARQLATGGPAAAAAAGATDGVPSASNDMCQNCKTIVMEAAAILQDPKTQAELLEYAKEGCTVFQDFKDQCEAYVTLYGPLVFNMLISYLQPDSLCTSMGYCTAAGGAPFVPLVPNA